MPDSYERPDTMEVLVDDLIELIALVEAAESLGCWFNGNVSPSPGWDRHAYESWRIRGTYFELDELDDVESLVDRNAGLLGIDASPRPKLTLIRGGRDA